MSECTNSPCLDWMRRPSLSLGLPSLSIERSTISHSNSHYKFYPPDWSHLELYLFPWILEHDTVSSVNLSRMCIKHMAFRFWEYLTTNGKVPIKVDEKIKNVPLGGVHGWWLEDEGDRPSNYLSWRVQYNGNIPSKSYLFFNNPPVDYNDAILAASAKPWPESVGFVDPIVLGFQTKEYHVGV